jgi:hypothetical protein
MGRVFSIALFLSIAACAAPEVYRGAADFSEAKFARDLDECRGGNPVQLGRGTVKDVLVGSAEGTRNGISYAAGHVDVGDAAAYGVAAGAAVGLGAGVYNAIKKRNLGVEQCLMAKGYFLAD